MTTLLFIGTGGFIGSVLRYLLSQHIQWKVHSVFPFGTLAVNILGCLIIGLVIAWSERTHMNPEWRLFLSAGLCGGFTTFSAFSHETLLLVREGQSGQALLYVIASIVLGLLATLIGYTIVRVF